MNKLLIVGTVAFDSIETPFGKAEKILGGSAPYIALSASKLGVPTSIISVVGGDFTPSYLEMLHEHQIETAGIQIVKEGKTFFWKGKYHTDLNNRDTLVTDLNTLSDFQPIVSETDKNAPFLMLGNLHPTIQMQVIEQLPKRPKLIVLDTMNYWMEHSWDELMAVLKKVDVVTINDSEARQLSGEYSLVKSAQKIQEMGVKYVVIKKGEHGALLFHKNEVFFAPALPLEEVFDPTGAGDTFAGGFTGYLARTEDISFENMKRALIFGSNLASFCVEKFGSERLQTVTEKELEERLFQFKQLTQFDIELEKS
ncbi:MAG: bifunctional hydroxymethylpyrimidine kinase/phosphomethylpyrimidine kinase [Flavobacteriaceae bacterium]|nr:bifunctional hydroxymethylpyrimidine kinase/phosphomethylpyrimidine kinase [Flavobacteriaceae bacterium]